MFILSHVIAGLIIGKILNNYTFALIGALFIDLDHLIPYVKHKVIFSPKKFWKTITNPLDPYGNQRNYLHSFFTWAIASVILLLIHFNIGLALSLGYLSHILLDMFDGSDFYPFYPFKYNFKGPIKYLSVRELILIIILLAVFLIL